MRDRNESIAKLMASLFLAIFMACGAIMSCSAHLTTIGQ